MQSPTQEPDKSLPSDSSNDTPEWALYPLHNHSYHLKDKAGRPWLTLDLRSRAKSSDDPPTFFQKGVVGGTVSVSLEKEESIRSIEVTPVQFPDNVANPMASPTTDKTAPLTRTTSILTRISTRTSTRSSLKAPTGTSNLSGSLKGDHRLAFTFNLPKGLSVFTYVESGGGQREYLLPASVSDDAAGVHVEYELMVHVTKGLFHRSEKLAVPIVYTPFSRPSQPSVARQIAYHKNTPPPDPEADPEGWQTLPPLIFQGILFNTIEVEAVCTLSLAKPLCYSRGAALPLMLVIECENHQALDILSAPQAVVVQLIQETSYGPELLEMYDSRDQVEKRIHVVARAVWVKLDEEEAHPKRRRLSGEIHIPDGVAPCCHFLKLDIKHLVTMDAFEAEGFAPVTAMTPLLSETVQIVTAYAAGPPPRTYIGPEYEERVEEAPRRMWSLTKTLTWPARRREFS